MHIKKHLPLLAMLTLLLTAPAFAQQTMSMQQNMHGMSGTGSAANTAMMSGMMKMQRAMMAAPVTGDPDRDFVAMMIPHHLGAIEMAEVELQYGKEPEIRQLAANIIAAQKEEVAEMKGWQKAKHACK